MKIVHIFRSEPTPAVEKLANILSEGQEAIRFPLYEGPVDYDRLIELVFSNDNDKVISWW
jgi:hypothetical protein